MQQRSVTVADGHLSILEAGAGGRPFLLVHGFTGAKEDFADHLDALAERGWWAVAPDLRGHGDSMRPDEVDHYSLDHFAADLDALVAALGWDRFTLLGHSMGGMIVQVWAAEHHHRLDGLVLMDTSGGPLGFLDPDIAAMGGALALDAGMAAVKEVLDAMADDAPLTNEAFERVCAERDGYREWSDSKLLTASPAMYAAMLPAFPAMADRHDALAAMTVPTLVVHGSLDAEFIDASQRLAATIPGARLVVFDGGGHSPQFETPGPWFDAITEFLDTL